MATARHWRVRSLDGFSSSRLGLARLEFRDGTGADLTGSGTPSADSTDAGAVANAFDGSDTTFWRSGNKHPDGSGWIAYDFGSAVEVQSVYILGPSTFSWFQIPAHLIIEKSDDGLAWSTAWEGPDLGAVEYGANDTGMEMEFFDPSIRPADDAGGAAFWAIDVIDKSDPSNIAYSIETLDLLVGSVSEIGTNNADSYWTASDQRNNNDAFKAAPGVSGFWAATDNGTQRLSAVAKAGTRWNPDTLLLTSRGDEFAPEQMPTEFKIYRSNGGPLVELLHVTGETGWTDGETRTFTLSTGSGDGGTEPVDPPTNGRTTRAGLQTLYQADGVYGKTTRIGLEVLSETDFVGLRTTRIAAQVLRSVEGAEIPQIMLIPVGWDPASGPIPGTINNPLNPQN